MCRIFEGNTGTYGGPQINLDSEVLRPDGTSIPGLYAAGECANGEFYYRDYIAAAAPWPWVWLSAGQPEEMQLRGPQNKAEQWIPE